MPFLTYADTRPWAKAIREAAPQHAATVRRLIFDRLSDAQRTALEEVCSVIIDALTEEPLA